jgi:PucR C-terminal helix-turn-helix domain/GAF domain
MSSTVPATVRAEPDWALGSIESCDRLAAIDLESIQPEVLLRVIEAEAVRLLALESARLELDGRRPNDQDVMRTPTGLVIQLSCGRLVGEGELPEAWEAQSRIFAAHVKSVLEAHQALTASRGREVEVRSLYASVGHLRANLEVEGVLRTVVERARELLRSEIAYIMLLDAGGRTLRMRVVTGNRTPSFAAIERPVRPGVSTDIGVPVQTPDFLNEVDLDHDPETDQQARLEGVRSVLAVPLKTQFSVLGSLLVANREVKTFSEREVAALASLAEHAALALDNARLYEEAVHAASAASVIRAEAQARLESRLRVDQLQDRLTELLLAGHGVVGVAEVLAGAFTTKLLVTDWRHRLVARAVPRESPERAEPPASGFMRRREVREALAICARNQATASVGCEYMVTPIAARRELLGYIWAAYPVDADSLDILQASIEQAARVVALEMLREREAVETERRLRRDFMYELLSERPLDPAIMAPRARQVWPRMGVDHRPLVLSVTAAPDVGGNPVERGRRLLAEDRPSDFVTVHGRYLVVLTPTVKRRDVLAEVAEIRNLLARNGIQAAVTVGVVCRGLMATREAILAARSLLELLAPRQIVWAEGLEALTVLFDPTDRRRLHAFIEHSLAPFQGRQPLMLTLQAYYEAGGNRADAARRLGVHVNTLRQRLDRIEALLGGSVDESSRAIPIRLALLATGVTTEP